MSAEPILKTETPSHTHNNCAERERGGTAERRAHTSQPATTIHTYSTFGSRVGSLRYSVPNFRILPKMHQKCSDRYLWVNLDTWKLEYNNIIIIIIIKYFSNNSELENKVLVGIVTVRCPGGTEASVWSVCRINNVIFSSFWR